LERNSSTRRGQRGCGIDHPRGRSVLFQCDSHPTANDRLQLWNGRDDFHVENK
jgi:hypothetical protein